MDHIHRAQQQHAQFASLRRGQLHLTPERVRRVDHQHLDRFVVQTLHDHLDVGAVRHLHRVDEVPVPLRRLLAVSGLLCALDIVIRGAPGRRWWSGGRR